MDNDLVLQDSDAEKSLLKTILEVSLTGIIIFKPILSETGSDIIDFQYEFWE